MKKLFIILASMAIMLTGCGKDNNDNSEIPTGGDVESSSVSDSSSNKESEPEVVPPKDSKVRLFAAGDNLIHSSIYKQANERANYNGYDFTYAYQYVEELISPADISFLNQETVIANDIYEPSNWPNFNSPTQLGDHMLKLGFDVFNHANNHVLDKGTKGALATLDYWDKHPEATVIGMYRNEADMNNIRVVEKNGIKIAFLGYMEHTNGIPLPAETELKITYLKELDLIKSQIEKAKEISDCVVVSTHWGVECLNTVNENQKELARKFIEWGADAIIGTQPHAIQTMEYITRTDGTKGFVAYSLGNFISAMSQPHTMIGMTLDFNIVKNGKTGLITIEDVKAIPVITQYESVYKNVRIIPYKDYTPELANKHGVRSKGTFNYDYVTKIITDYTPAEFLKIN